MRGWIDVKIMIHIETVLDNVDKIQGIDIGLDG